MARALYKITPEIYMTNNSVFVVKVNNDDFCYTDTGDCARLVLTKLANALVDELNEDPNVKSGCIQIYRDTTDRDVIIGKIASGRLWGQWAKEAVYTITYREVSYGLVRLPPAPVKEEKKVESIAKVEEAPVSTPQYSETVAVPATPQYATFEFLAEPVPKVAEVSFAPLNKRPERSDREEFNIDKLIAELKVTLAKIKLE